MKILVFGAGAIGGFLGGKLARSGHEVSLVTRPTKAAILNREGLLLTENDIDERVRPFAFGSLGEAMSASSSYDLLILSMKSYDLDVALAELTPYRNQIGTLLTMQNGIGVEEMVIKAFPEQSLIAGSLTTPVRVKAPNHLIIERSDRGAGLAPVKKGQDITAWVELFQRAGVETTAVADFQAMKWSKALLNIMGNATAAILNMHPGEVYASRVGFKIEQMMLQECLRLMDAQQIPLVDLPGAPARKAAAAIRYIPGFLLRPLTQRQIAKGRGGKMPSFYVDLHYGQKGKSEVIYHNGAIAAVAATVGQQAPANKVLNALLLAMVQGEIHPKSYDQEVDKLWRKIQEAAA